MCQEPVPAAGVPAGGARLQRGGVLGPHGARRQGQGGLQPQTQQKDRALNVSSSKPRTVTIYSSIFMLWTYQNQSMAFKVSRSYPQIVYFYKQLQGPIIRPQTSDVY